jgi:CubicO group peptidase (beta-lactamase class C family)
MRLIFVLLAIQLFQYAPAFAQTRASSDSMAGASISASMTATDVGAFLDRFMPEQLKSSGIPGAEVVVVKDGKVIAAKGYGFADVEARRPMTTDYTLMNIASIKKLFEGIAIMQLVEQGRLDLDQDVSTYLDFSIPTPPGGVPVTLRRRVAGTTLNY